MNAAYVNADSAHVDADAVRHRRRRRGGGSHAHARSPLGALRAGLRRLARRGGVKRLSAATGAAVGGAARARLATVLQTALALVAGTARKTVTALDVVYALRHHGHTLYSDVDPGGAACGGGGGVSRTRRRAALDPLVVVEPAFLDARVLLRALPEVRVRGRFPDARLVDTVRRHMAPADAARVQAALASGGDNDVVMPGPRIAGILLSRRDARTLRPGAWLNDEVVNLYVALLLRRHAAFVQLRDAARVADPALPRLRPAHVFTSFFWTKLTQDAQGRTVHPATYTYANVARWTGRPRSATVDLFACSYVLVPINLTHEHWLLGVVLPQERVVTVLDSLNDSPEPYLAALMRYLNDEHLDKHGTPLPEADAWQLLRTHAPQQRNGVDCGAFLLFNADCTLMGEPLSFGQADMPAFRRHVLLACLNGTLTLP